jgi:CRP/FNR family transcriptional regulator
MKTEKRNDAGNILMGCLVLSAIGRPMADNGPGLYLLTREREARRMAQQAPEAVSRHVCAHTGGMARAGRIREEGKMSELTRTVTFLTQVPLFRYLDKRQLRGMARAMTPRRYAAGEVILRQGRGGIGLFVVVSGKAEAVHALADGTQVVVNTFGPTDYFGELAMLNDEPRTASVVAVENTECLVLVRWNFLGKLRRNRGMATRILQEQVRRFQKALSVL